MNKEDLKKTLAEKKDTMEELARSQPMEVKTIDNTRLSLLAYTSIASKESLMLSIVLTSMWKK
jgi:hypothetical protein